VVTACSARTHPMEALFISFSTVTLAEMGDRTQLLSLMLVARYGRPCILAGILSATLANHLAAGFIGAWFGGFLDRIVLDMVVGVSMIVMALWALKPDKLGEDGVPTARRGVFIATLVAFFIAEIGDKTQVATVALAAAYSSLAAVVIGTTAGMLAANLPVVLLGNRFARKLPMRAIHIGASVLFVAVALGLLFVLRALAKG
jgi:Ca2+/H+ antiporter, TMEM165/GDT1 family